MQIGENIILEILNLKNWIIEECKYFLEISIKIGSLAERFKAPDLGSGISGCMSSNLIAFITFLEIFAESRDHIS